MKRLKLSLTLLLVLLMFGTVLAGKITERNLIIAGKDGEKRMQVADGEEIYFKNGPEGLSVLFRDSNSEVSVRRVEEESFVIERNSTGDTVVKNGSLADIASLQEERSLRDSKVEIKSSKDGVDFSFSNNPEKVRLFFLKNPDRVVFDFIGIKGYTTASKAVRSANHPSGFRVVLDKKIVERFSLEGEDGNLALKSFSSRFLAQLEAEASGENVPVREKRNEIKGIAFVGENPEILRIAPDSKVSVDRKVKGDRVEITLKNSFVSKDKEQLIDASSLDGAVKELAIYNEKENVKIVAKMNGHDFAFDMEEEGSKREFIFKKRKVEPKEGVAGYAEEQVVTFPTNGAVGQVLAEDGEKARDVGGESTSYRGKKISLEFKDVDIHDVLRLMSEISKLNIIVGDDVKGTITVRLVNIPWDEALDVILKSKSLGKERLGNVIRVATLRTLQQEKESELAKKKAQEKLEEIKVRIITVNYALAKDLVPQIKELLTERGSVSVDERTNVLIVKDIAEVRDKSEKLVEYLDTQTQQVLIEAKIVEATSRAAHGFGVKWGASHTASAANPTGALFPYNMGINGAVNVPGPAPTGGVGFKFGSIGQAMDLDLTLNVMESEGRIKIVSSPKIATLDNSEAMIQQGVSIPIQTWGQNGAITTKYIDATLVLTTKPHITSDGSIFMSLSINKSEADWGHIVNGEPAILKKEAKNNILVKSGDTIVIGGVYTNLISKDTHGIPFLSDIPILGWLFKSQEEKVERTELLIFLTPRIMNRVKSSIPLQTLEEEQN